jgi:MFS transporter, DHA3 family, macrolide efflux protein
VTVKPQARPNLRRAAVLRNARFRRLFFANLASGLGNWLALVALQVDVYDRTQSGWWVGALLIANLLPSIFLGLLFGPLVDRLSRKGLMIASDLGRLVVFCALPFAGSAALIVALSVVAGVGTAFFRPAVLAGVPNLVSDEELPDANAILQLVEWGSTALGPLVGGALAAASGPHLAYWVNAVTFAVSAVFVAGIPARLLQSERPIGRGHWSDLREGFQTVRRSRPLFTVLVVWTIAMIALASVNLSEIFLAKQTLHSGDFGFGLLWSASGVGLVIGALSANGVVRRFGVRTAYPRALLLWALGMAGAAASPNVWIAAFAMAVAAVGNGVGVVVNITLVQRGAADHVRGRALAAIMSVNYTMMLAVFLAAGPATDALGARAVYSIAAGSLVVAAAFAARLLPREEAA